MKDEPTTMTHGDAIQLHSRQIAQLAELMLRVSSVVSALNKKIDALGDPADTSAEEEVQKLRAEISALLLHVPASKQ